MAPWLARLEAARAWLAQLTATHGGPPTTPAEDEGYRRGMTSLRRRLFAVVALTHIALSPLYVWLDVRLWRMGPEHHVQAYALMGIHVWTLAGAVLYLVLFGRGLNERDTSDGEQRLLRIAAWHFVAIPSALAITNQLAAGAVTIYAVGLVALVILAYEPPAIVTRWVASSALLVIAAAIALQRDAGALVTALFNVSLAAAGTIALYHLFDRYRCSAYHRERELARLNTIKDTIFRALDHDLKTPMMRVRRVARALDDDAAPAYGIDTLHLAHELDAATRQVSLVVDNLVAIAAPGPTHSRSDGPYALSDLFEQVMSAIGAQAAAKRIALEVELDDDALVIGNEAIAVAVLRNLLDNAVKFSYPGAAVQLEAHIGAEHVTISVRDSGIGIAPAIAQQLALRQPVRGSHGTRGESGTGIGLMVAQNFVEASGSSLRIEPSRDGGTVASFDLPRYRRRATSDLTDTPTDRAPATIGAMAAAR